jgi:hypothetical protein
LALQAVSGQLNATFDRVSDELTTASAGGGGGGATPPPTTP